MTTGHRPPGRADPERRERERAAADVVVGEPASESDATPAVDVEPEATQVLERYLGLRDAGRWDEAARVLADAGPDVRERALLIDGLAELGGLLAPPSDEVPTDLEELGRFRDLRLIGEGGLSRVFLAQDPRLGREVALKVLSPGAVSSRASRDWMLSEGRSLARLEHSSVVRVFEVDEAGGYAYIAMERVDGPSLYDAIEALRARVRGAGANDADERAQRAAAALEPMAARLKLVAQLAHALAYCHAQGIVHRDIKPANVLIDRDGTPKLIDFGLAHLGDEAGSLGLTQRLVGTSAYLAPEQVDAERTGASTLSDLFSLGVVLYELLTLENPFVRDSRAATMAAVSAAAPAPPSRVDRLVPTDAERICLHCLERQPEKRYPSMQALAADLEAFLDYRAISLRGQSLLRVLGLWLTRNRRQVLTGALVAAALMVTLAVTWFRRADVEREEVRETIGRHAARVAELREPRDFESALRSVLDARARVSALDDGLLRRMLFRSLEPELEAWGTSLSSRLHDVLGPVYATIEEQTLLEDRLRMCLTVFNQWRGALSMERQAMGDDTPNAPYFEPGTIDFPSEGRLWRVERDTYGMPGFDPHPLTGLTEGRYLFATSRPEGALLETFFSVRPWRPRSKLEVRPLASHLEESMLAHDGCDLALARGRWSDVYRQPAFEISEHLVTWEEMARVLPREEVDEQRTSYARLAPQTPTMNLLDDWSDAATVRWEVAAAYAQRAGARLPTAGELIVAHRDLDLARGAGAYWEWTLGTFDNQPDQVACFLPERYDLHGREAGGGALDPRAFLDKTARDGRPMEVRFRIARSRVPAAPSFASQSR